MITAQAEKIARRRPSLLRLAQELRNVSTTCAVIGSRKAATLQAAQAVGVAS